MKIISWNINGIRSFYKKPEFEWLFSQNFDIIFLQETKANPEQLDLKIKNPNGYFSFFDWSKEKKGYSGTAIYVKIKLLKNQKNFKKENKTHKNLFDSSYDFDHFFKTGLGVKDLDNEGRQVNLFLDDMVFINCYFPNGGGPISRQIYKQKYYDEFLNYLKKLQNMGYKKVIFGGDLNVAHEEIDIARPKENQNSVGFLPEERMWIDELIDIGFIDSFRNLYKNKIQYSWWDQKTRARERGIGWRIDYFFVTKNLENKIKKIEILDKVFGSDHAPIYLEL